jgi:hypothetical protein
MPISCGRCSERRQDLSLYVNYQGWIICLVCADELRDEK